MHDAKFRDLTAPDRFRGQGDVRPRANVLVQKRAQIHPVKLIATQDKIVIVRAFQKVSHVLANGVGRALVPLRTLGGLLRRQNIDKTPRKIVELVARLDMSMQRHAVELRQDIDRTQSRIQAVTDRDIDQPIFSAQRHRRLRAILGQRK